MSVFLKLVISILNTIPFKFRLHFARFVGGIFSLIPTRERKIAELQIRLIGKKYNLTPGIWQIYAGLAQTVAESLDLDRALEECTITWQGLPELKEHINRSGIVFLSAHTANWEILAADAVNHDIPLYVVARTANNPHLQVLLSGLRKKAAVNTIWRKSFGAAKETLKILEQKLAVAALVDQDTEVNNISVNFFGRPARVPRSIVELALRRKIPIFSAFIFRTSLLSSTVYLEPFRDLSSAGAVLQEFHTRLEKYIKLYPDQWVWFHKRWRTTPEGLKLSSYDYIKYLQNEVARA